MRQLVYISTPSPDATLRLAEILRVSQVNNARAGVSGLLYYNGRRFLQALEGEPVAVATTLGRIRTDPRHRAVVILSDRDVTAREFGPWAMADATADGDPAAFLARVDHLAAGATPAVRASFTSFARLAA